LATNMSSRFDPPIQKPILKLRWSWTI